MKLCLLLFSCLLFASVYLCYTTAAINDHTHAPGRKDKSVHTTPIGAEQEHDTSLVAEEQEHSLTTSSSEELESAPTTAEETVHLQDALDSFVQYVTLADDKVELKEMKLAFLDVIHICFHVTRHAMLTYSLGGQLKMNIENNDIIRLTRDLSHYFVLYANRLIAYKERKGEPLAKRTKDGRTSKPVSRDKESAVNIDLMPLNGLSPLLFVAFARGFSLYISRLLCSCDRPRRPSFQSLLVDLSHLYQGEHESLLGKIRDQQPNKMQD